MNGERKDTLSRHMPQPAILEELDQPEDTLLIAFGSMRLEHPFPPFEFRGAFEGIPAKKVFVRDPYQLWYQRGLPGIANRIEGVGCYLKRLLAEQEVNKGVFYLVKPSGRALNISDN